MIHLLQHIKLGVTQGLAGTGWSQRCAKNLQTTKNLRYVEPGACSEGRQRCCGGGGGQGSWAELMLHQKAFTAVCYLIDVHSSQGQAQDNCRTILLLILKEQKSLESKVNLQRPCSCSGTYCRRGSRTAHQANAISSFSFYCVCKVHLALLTSVISTPKILSCWATQTFHQQTP